MRVVHVQIAAIPARSPLHRRKRRTRLVEAHRGREFGGCALGHVRNAEHQRPCAGYDRPRQIGRGGVRLRDGERTLVAPAPAAKTVGIPKPEVDDGSLLASRVGKLDSDPPGAGRNVEWYLAIMLEIRMSEDALKYLILRARIHAAGCEQEH